MFLGLTRTGRGLYASAATLSPRDIAASISASATCWYALSGAIAGLCGYLWVARYGIAYTEIALGYELNVIAACVIGGVSIGGGVGSVAGTLLGALFLGVIVNALPVINVSPFWQMAISGAVILAAVIVNARSERRAGKLILPEAAPAQAARSAKRRATTAQSVAADRAMACYDRRQRAAAVAGQAAALGDDPSRPACRGRRRRHALSPYFLDLYNLSDMTQSFSEKAIIALGMALLILVREIDLSVSAMVALASLAMGLPRPRSGARGAFFTGARGRRAVRCRQRPLGDGFRPAFDRGDDRHHVAVPRHRPGGARRRRDHGLSPKLHQPRAECLSRCRRSIVPSSFVLAFAFAFVLHKTVLGRMIYAIGNNPEAARIRASRSTASDSCSSC